MCQKKLLQFGIAGVACAVVLLAAEPWKNKDYTLWTSEEVDKVLTDSPWAKQITINPQSGQSPRREGGMGRRGGIGFPGGGYPGGGYPGGGYPGGGYPGGGGGYPGGGNSGGGGGYPRGGGSDQGGRIESMTVTVRWESGLPVQHALLRQGASGGDESKAAAEAGQKYYVIALFGFRMPGEGRSHSDNSDQDGNSRSKDVKDDIRSKLLDAAQLIPRGKRTLYAEDVQVNGFDSTDLRFLFPRSTTIDTGDKEVDFILEMRGIKIEHKFHLADMKYQGQLAL